MMTTFTTYSLDSHLGDGDQDQLTEAVETDPDTAANM